MLSELCRELRNWFDRGQPHFHGAFEIKDGHIADVDFNDAIQPNQYYRIQGSVFNDGVYKNDSETTLTDELFVGAVTLMAIPKEVLTLSEDIDKWIEQYGGVESTNMSPFSSESFGGYSYSKGSGASNSGAASNSVGWQSIFANRLNKWRKI